ncbi:MULTISPECIES: lasso peptide biosynthesis B2 protein [Actinomadura]|uniref:Lasso peptide biosynthesis B2 protein n=1 Tax=Actinomadura yumaensis TaxID=111807 RepID=A0ABW2CDU6_9ACTN|nr:lasso peptide biosynthesis B2 protein [Actinomadura sp. J1-007]MWK38213.1 lasso peptide biosynthesis B2 protein [Actinomadura sp. J1-007]
MNPRIRARLAAAGGAALARLRPHTIRAVLSLLRAGARPARRHEAEALCEDVLAVSLRAHGHAACLRRSLAVVLLGRMRGVWPTWCVGVLLAPPFTAHAWVEAEDAMVGERIDARFYGRLIRVAPSGDPASPRTCGRPAKRRGAHRRPCPSDSGGRAMRPRRPDGLR